MRDIDDRPGGVGEGALAAVGGPGGRSASLYKSLNQHVRGYPAEKYSRSISLSQRVFQGHWQPKGHELDRALGPNSIFKYQIQGSTHILRE